MPLDRKFLEWFGHMLLMSAKNLEQGERFSEWLRAGFPPGVDQEKWLEPYLQIFPQGSVKGARELRELFNGFFSSMGVVSRADYLELEKKYSELKREFEELKGKVAADRATGFDLLNQSMEMVRNLSESNARLFEQWQNTFLTPTDSEKKK